MFPTINLSLKVVAYTFVSMMILMKSEKRPVIYTNMKTRVNGFISQLRKCGSKTLKRML